MNIRPLRTYSNPDLSDFVVHFTGRDGPPSGHVPEDITNREPWDRLAQILMTYTVRAFPPYGSSEPAVCFTECTRAGIQALMTERRYAPCGLAFTKDTVFRSGGGPALYIRGDEWPEVDHLPPKLRARATRFWPGADEASGGGSTALVPAAAFRMGTRAGVARPRQRQSSQLQLRMGRGRLRDSSGPTVAVLHRIVCRKLRKRAL